MSKKYNAIILSLVLAFGILSYLIPAYAGNGTRELGFSARDSAMAGATTASPYDTSCLVKNPAALVWIGNRIDAEYQNIIPQDVSMNTEGPAVVQAAVPYPLANRGVKTEEHYRLYSRS